MMELPKRRPITIAGVVTLIAGAAALFARLRSPLPLAAYDDDAFYYFQVARNLATGHGSTFDGIHLTNGYHPLWLLLCAALAWLAKGRAFFALLQCVAFLSFATGFFAARAVFRFVCQRDAVVEFAAAIVALQCVLLMHGGMEITLTLPLALLLCAFRLRPAFYWNSRNAAFYGVLAALVVLSRLDALLWIALVLCAELALAWQETVPPRALLLAVLATAFPLSLYAISNHYWFHSWMPVSGAAKQLRVHHGFTLVGVRHSFYLLQQTYGLLLVYPALVLTACALLVLLKPATLSRRPDVRAISLTLLLFPAVQIAMLCFVSDWPMWSWYLYPFCLATTGALLCLLASLPSEQPSVRSVPHLAAVAACSVLFALSLAYTAHAASGEEAPLWADFARTLQGFERTHPGVYAMGDCAGTSTYLLQHPVIQTEGLVMDAGFLSNIRQQLDLQQVLRSYGVRYYVTLQAAPENGCYRVEEPFLAGPDSPRMRSTLCQAPTATFPFGGVMLRVFDLQPGAAH